MNNKHNKNSSINDSYTVSFFDTILKMKYTPYVIMIFFALMLYLLIYAFGGNFGPTAHNWFNNYSRQAYSWLQGRLDVPYDRPYLEIAFFGDRMYISFPPFPSIVLLPIVFLYGYNTPDHIIVLCITLIALVYAYKIAIKIVKDIKLAMFFTMFLILGTNYLHISLWGAVWYMAQNMAFTLMLISIYYAITDKKWHSYISLFALCASMGCRPFNALYLPVILFLITKRENVGLLAFARKLVLYAIPAILLGSFYMWLNYVRFGSIIEFGHNYLPEFTLDYHGQFHPSRITHNLSMMFFGTDITYAINHGFPHIGRPTFAFWLASPIFVSFTAYFIAYLHWWRKESTVDSMLIKVIPFLVLLHMFTFSFHRTLGGRQFGSRYIVDTLPVIFFGLLLIVPKFPRVKHMIINFPLMLFGALINFHGTIMFFIFYFPI